MNLKHIFPLLLSACLFRPAVSNAQVPLRANDPIIRYDLIRPAHFHEKITVFDSTGQATAEWLSEHVIQIDTPRHQFLFIRFTPYSIGRFVIDSCWNNDSGPIHYSLSSYPATRTESHVFHPASVTAHMNRRGTIRDTTVNMPNGYIDDTSVWELFGFMELKKGVRYSLNCYGSDKLVPLLYTVEYSMDDYLPGVGGESRHCRVIDVSYEDNDWHLWIDPQSHRTIKGIMKSKTSTLTLTLL